MESSAIRTDDLLRARNRGCDFLLRALRPDGGIGRPERGVADYYKVISALQVCGETRAANQLCDWIRRFGMTPDGDFGPRPSEAAGYFYAYFNSWVVLGAHRLGQYDLSSRGMDFIMRFHDPVSGGFYSSSTERGESTLQDLWVVSGCAQAALATGRLDIACSTGHWMKDLLRRQPDFPRRLFGVMSRALGLHTNFDPADDVRYVCAQDATRDQFVFNPGIAAGFLCRLYQATGQSEWLQLAKEYLLFAENMNGFLFRLLPSGKVGWASAVLYTLTGERKYARLAGRVAHVLLEAQAPDGSWNAGDIFPPEAAIDITAEMVVWMDEIWQALGSAQAAEFTGIM
jgi:hypothetical protein